MNRLSWFVLIVGLSLGGTVSASAEDAVAPQTAPSSSLENPLPTPTATETILNNGSSAETGTVEIRPSFSLSKSSAGKKGRKPGKKGKKSKTEKAQKTEIKKVVIKDPSIRKIGNTSDEEEDDQDSSKELKKVKNFETATEADDPNITNPSAKIKIPGKMKKPNVWDP